MEPRNPLHNDDGYARLVGGSIGPEAPGDLELVRAFVNTLDVEAGRDQLNTPANLEAWGHQHDLDVQGATEAELSRTIELREALRQTLIAHHDGVGSAPGALAVINSSMEWGAVRPTLSDDGLTWSSSANGVPRLVGRLLSAIARAAADGTWSRLKACGNDACRWAFYDHSRSRTGRWCSMQVCGNRAKQHRFQRASK